MKKALFGLMILLGGSANADMVDRVLADPVLKEIIKAVSQKKGVQFQLDESANKFSCFTPVFNTEAHDPKLLQGPHRDGCDFILSFNNPGVSDKAEKIIVNGKIETIFHFSPEGQYVRDKDGTVELRSIEFTSSQAK